MKDEVQPRPNDLVQDLVQPRPNDHLIKTCPCEV
jgi:hypothetical protein